MTFWIVRAGEKGEQECTALENNLVTIAWNELPDISGISDRPSLKRLWQKVYPHHKKAESANMMGQVWSFLKEIEIDDLVGLPLKSRPSLMIGEVQSGYQFKEITNDTKHIRIVRWFGEIPKSEIDQDLLKSLGTFMTVFRVRKPNAEKRIRSILHSVLSGSENSLNINDREIRSQVQISSSDIPAILNEFRRWIESNDGQSHLNSLQKEKSDVRNILQKIHELDKNSSEFIEWILYGLLPHAGTKNAKRASMFPAFRDIKSLFSANYGYKDQDWKNIANLVFELASNFETSPQQIGKWIDTFVSDRVYSKGLQCGAISPLLFCINDKFPIINYRVIHTYNDFASVFHWDDIMSSKLEEYVNNIERCKKLIATIGASELYDLNFFDIFCYWYDNFFKSEKEDEDDDDIGYEIAEKIKLPDVNFNEFLDSINIENIFNLESHSLKNPEMIKVIDIIKECSAGRWVLPNFQRYFDWSKNDVREFLELIFYDYYVGSLLLWEIGSNLPLEIMPIKGVDMKDESNAREIILDGQQRITSLLYAIKTPNFALKGGKTPLYFYINFSKYFSENNDEIIEVLPRKLDYEESFGKLLFPFYYLENFRKWVYDLETFLQKKVPDHYDKVRILRPVIELKLSHIREGFEIPYITLPSTMELHDVTKIFERINTMGMLLNVFDLLIARLSIYKISLRELWEHTVKEFPDIDRYNYVSRKLPIYIIQSISLCYNKTSSCKRKDILDIYRRVFASKSLSFDDKWHEMSTYTNLAIQRLENLRDGFGVKDETELPFASMIPILAAILREIDNRENKMDCNSKLKMWYWCAVFSNAYSSAVESQLALDFKELKEWFNDDLKIPKTVDRARREVMTIDLRKVQVQSSAIYRGVLSLLALKGARDFDTNQTLELARSNHKDHIFPRSEFALKDELNSVLNMTWMSNETNMKKGR